MQALIQDSYIKGAYLNANLDEELYLELDPVITKLVVEHL